MFPFLLIKLHLREHKNLFLLKVYFSLVLSVLDHGQNDPLPMPLQPRLVREARARIARTSHKNAGARQLDNYFVGQIVGSMNQVKSVRNVVEELVEEYADTLERLDEWAE